jgi:hypothetical protein
MLDGGFVESGQSRYLQGKLMEFRIYTQMNGAPSKDSPGHRVERVPSFSPVVGIVPPPHPPASVFPPPLVQGMGVHTRVQRL